MTNRSSRKEHTQSPDIFPQLLETVLMIRALVEKRFYELNPQSIMEIPDEVLMRLSDRFLLNLRNRLMESYKTPIGDQKAELDPKKYLDKVAKPLLLLWQYYQASLRHSPDMPFDSSIFDVQLVQLRDCINFYDDPRERLKFIAQISVQRIGYDFTQEARAAIQEIENDLGLDEEVDTSRRLENLAVATDVIMDEKELPQLVLGRLKSFVEEALTSDCEYLELASTELIIKLLQVLPSLSFAHPVDKEEIMNQLIQIGNHRQVSFAGQDESRVEAVLQSRLELYSLHCAIEIVSEGLTPASLTDFLSKVDVDGVCAEGIFTAGLSFLLKMRARQSFNQARAIWYEKKEGEFDAEDLQLNYLVGADDWREWPAEHRDEVFWKTENLCRLAANDFLTTATFYELNRPRLIKEVLKHASIPIPARIIRDLDQFIPLVRQAILRYHQLECATLCPSGGHSTANTMSSLRTSYELLR
jgi:hypothetical protein